jgi:hypothetical protein
LIIESSNRPCLARTAPPDSQMGGSGVLLRSAAARLAQQAAGGSGSVGGCGAGVSAALQPLWRQQCLAPGPSTSEALAGHATATRNHWAAAAEALGAARTQALPAAAACGARPQQEQQQRWQQFAWRRGEGTLAGGQQCLLDRNLLVDTLGTVGGWVGGQAGRQAG